MIPFWVAVLLMLLKLLPLMAFAGRQENHCGDWHLLLWLPSERRWL